MKVMVTGASGFIGGHVVDRLLKDGHQVIAFDRLHKGEVLRWGVFRFLVYKRDATAVNESVAVAGGFDPPRGVLSTP